MAETYSCPNGHQWEDTWGDDISLASGQVTCPVCGVKVQATLASEYTPTVQFVEPVMVPPVAGSAAGTWPDPGMAPPEKVVVPGYEVLGELGRGGMGVVYQARQCGLKRLVALKMLLAGAHANTDSLARFTAEGETVARLQHPNIVQIYEVGEHEGRPFFSMEYVDGGSLHSKAKGNPQPVREAAELIATLARAMHAAHAKGVIHRDLKPANVLLTKDGQPKITDFGLAKQLNVDSQLSQTGDVMGTPSYMAPEQAAGRTHEIGPAADVYALGAVLYELLTGRPPFKSETPIDTMLQVLYADPVPPSHLRAKTPRDLETICLKCLEKDPRKRFASAAALAEDLQRFLDDQPILARPVGRLTRAVKWTKHHPASAGMAAVAFLAGLVVIGVMAWYNVDLQKLNLDLAAALTDAKQKKQEADEQRDKARAAEKKAEDRRRLAEARFRDAMNAVRAMLTEVGQNELANTPSMERVRQRLLEKALAFQKDFLTQKSDDPAVRQQVGQAYQLVGDIYTMLGRYADAEDNYRAGIAQFRTLANNDPRQPEYRRDLAACYFQLGRLYQLQDQLVPAEEALREAERLQRRLVAQQPRADFRQQLARTCNDLGLVLRKSNRLEQARSLYQEALAIQTDLCERYRDNPEFGEDLAGSHNDYGIVLKTLKKPETLLAAEKEYAAALKTIGSLVQQYPEVSAYRRKQAAFYNNRGNVRRDLKADDVRADFDEALKLWRQLRDDYPLVPQYQFELANTYNSRGLLLAVKPETWKEAADDFSTAQKLLLDLVKKYEMVAAYHSALGGTLDNGSDLPVKQEKWKEAREQLDEALRYHQAALKINDREPAYRRALRNHYVKLANLLLANAKEADPAAAAAAAQKLWELGRDDPEDIRLAAVFFGRCMDSAQKKANPQAAQGYGRQALALLRLAVAMGYANVQGLEKAAAFDAVRKAFPEEFKELVAQMKKGTE